MHVPSHFPYYLFMCYHFQKLNDEAKRTGAGKQKKLGDFENLCIDFVRAAKGRHSQ